MGSEHSRQGNAQPVPKNPLATQTETVGCSQPSSQTHSDLSLPSILGPQNWGLAHSVQLSKGNVLCDKSNDFPLEHVFIWKFIASCVWEEENISK